MNAKDVLNELKWREDRALGKATIHYVHRGAPGDVKVIEGDNIEELGSSHFYTVDSTVPYHRIFRIDYDGQEIFQRGK